MSGTCDGTPRSWRRGARPSSTRSQALDVADFRAALRNGDENHPPLAVTSVGRAVVAVRGLHASRAPRA